VLDQAKAHEKILVTSYGSGAGADSFLLEVTDQLPKLRQSWNYFLENQLARCEPTNYRAYRAMMELKE
jgi:hydroxymethylglutaryl-CoA synthase